MRTTYFSFIFALLASQAQAIPLPHQPLYAYDCAVCNSLSQVDLSRQWPVNNSALGHDTLHQQKSKKYRISTTLKQLHEGLALHTLASGAIIRIVPQHRDKTVKPNFQIQTQNNTLLPIKEASVLFASEDALEDSPLADDTLTILQLKPELGFGQFILKSNLLKGHENDIYTIHVFDQASTTYLSVKTDKARYHYGDKLIATFTLSGEAGGYPIDVITANLVLPEGEAKPLKLKEVSPNLYTATLSLLSSKGYHGENWYIEAQVETNVGGNTIKRLAHSAFSYVIPSAAIRSINVSKSTVPFSYVANIETSTSSRYAMQVVLFATNRKGKTVPIETIQSAAWYTPGMHQMHFSFSPERARQFKPPYYLGAIQLTDYGQLKPVYEYNQKIDLNRLAVND